MVILDEVGMVQDTPIGFGLVMIRSFDRTFVKLGSEGRAARELLMDAMKLEWMRYCWGLFYGPRMKEYFFSVYPVREPQLRPPDDPGD